MVRIHERLSSHPGLNGETVVIEPCPVLLIKKNILTPRWIPSLWNTGEKNLPLAGDQDSVIEGCSGGTDEVPKHLEGLYTDCTGQ